MTQEPNIIPFEETPPAAAARWFAQSRRGAMTDAEAGAFEAWLAANPEHRAAFEDVATVWDEVEGARLDPAVMTWREEATASLQRARSLTFFKKVAAIVLIVGLCAVGGGLVWSASGPGPTSYATRVGERSTINLADGSKVMLDTDSEIKVWPKSIVQRRLTLVRGRAYFEVAKDANHPFVVTTSRGSVTALGTAFDVRDDAAGVKIVLVEGRVRIRSAHEEHKPLEMNAGYEYLGDRTGWRMLQADTNTETSWVKGALVFNEQPLSLIVAELNRYATAKIVISDAQLGAQRLSAVLRIGDVEAFLHSVEVLNLASVRRTPTQEILLVPPI